MVRTLGWRILCVGLTAAILLLALLPNDSVPQVGFGWDKLNHSAAIAVVTVLAFLSVKPYRRAASVAFWYGMSLGVLIELCQAVFTTTRSAEWGDLLADFLGAGAACCFITAIKIKKETK